jgi:Pyruvate/2-oxoacid:ferredoxin oxidoreductase delta subunit
VGGSSSGSTLAWYHTQKRKEIKRKIFHVECQVWQNQHVYLCLLCVLWCESQRVRMTYAQEAGNICIISFNRFGLLAKIKCGII